MSENTRRGSSGASAALRGRRPNPDPTLLRSRREALLVLAIWLAACSYCVTYAGMHGYHRPAAEVQYVFGFPDWVFWGLVVPWLACTVVSFLVAQFVMSDEHLPADKDDSPSEGAGHG